MQGVFQRAGIEEFIHNRLMSVTYLKIAQEEGETGNPHLQGYFELSTKVSLKGARELWVHGGFPPPHLEIAWDTIKAQAYVGNLKFEHADGHKKTGKVLWEWEYGSFVPDKGEARRQGKSWNDSLLEMKMFIDGGASLYTLYQHYFIQMIYCGKAVAAYSELVGFRRKFPELSEEISEREERAVIIEAMANHKTQWEIKGGA